MGLVGRENEQKKSQWESKEGVKKERKMPGASHPVTHPATGQEIKIYKIEKGKKAWGKHS